MAHQKLCRNVGIFPQSLPTRQNDRTVWLGWEDSNWQMTIFQENLVSLLAIPPELVEYISITNQLMSANMQIVPVWTDKLIDKSLSVSRNRSNKPDEFLAATSARDRIMLLFELIAYGRQAS
jgi:hypothetical protein